MKNIFSWFMSNLELWAMCGCLMFIYKVEMDWKYWVTIFLVAICSGISTSWNKTKND